MEFPRLGEHCSESTCGQLDFLPVKCDACEKLFCHNHMAYSKHSCPSAYKKDVQVPVCPLCNSPVFTRRGEQPDISVGAHIDNNCNSDTAKTRRKVFSNRCSAKGCKAKEMIPVNCSECLLNFCLKHRHPTDHRCEGRAAGLRRKAADAAAARFGGSSGPFANKNKASQPSNQRLGNKPTDVQGNMSEDEALARALAASMQQDSSSPSSIAGNNSHLSAQEAADLALAQAISESERLHQNQQRAQTAGGSRDKCVIS